MFTVLQPDINYVLHTGACILGFTIHYIVPQLRKHLPWLCIAKPILKAKEFGQFEVQNLSKIMWFETMYVALCFFERNILYPLIFLSALTADSGAIADKFGLTLGTALVVVSGLKCKFYSGYWQVLSIIRIIFLSSFRRCSKRILRYRQPVHHSDFYRTIFPDRLQAVQ